VQSVPLWWFDPPLFVGRVLWWGFVGPYWALYVLQLEEVLVMWDWSRMKLLPLVEPF
jgi:hypothetical protein